MAITDNFEDAIEINKKPPRTEVEGNSSNIINSTREDSDIQLQGKLTKE